MPMRASAVTAERLAYWYMRFNGFLQIENFIVHPGGRGGQRTDADLLGVRFPHRTEMVLDIPDAPMRDDTQRLRLSDSVIDVVIAEVKTNQPCQLNGPWTDAQRQNMHRVLYAIGCLRKDIVNAAAESIYETGSFESDGLRVRLMAFGRQKSGELSSRYPTLVQITWDDATSFIYERLFSYRRSKADAQQWEADGRWLRRAAETAHDASEFRSEVLRAIGT